MPDAVIVLDLDGRVADLNPAAQELMTCTAGCRSSAPGPLDSDLRRGHRGRARSLHRACFSTTDCAATGTMPWNRYRKSTQNIQIPVIDSAYGVMSRWRIGSRSNV